MTWTTKLKKSINVKKRKQASKSRERLNKAREYIKSFFFPTSEIDILPLGSWSLNVVKVIVNGEREYVAKSFSASKYHPDMLLVMKNWVNSTSISSGILSPHFIPSIKGEYFPELVEESKRLTVTEKIDIMPFNLNSINDFRVMGTAIGKLHKLAPQGVKNIPYFIFQETNDEVESYWHLLDGEELKIFTTILSNRINNKKFSIQITHNDLHPANLLSSHGVPTFLDFDHIILGPKANDLGQALSAFWINSSLDSLEKSMNALIEGYRSVNEVSDEEVSLLPLFALRKICISFTWFKGLMRQLRDNQKVTDIYDSLRRRANILYLFARKRSLL